MVYPGGFFLKLCGAQAANRRETHMELSNYVKQILNIYNYYDGAIIMDRKGIIEYYYNSRKDIKTLTN